MLNPYVGCKKNHTAPRFRSHKKVVTDYWQNALYSFVFASLLFFVCFLLLFLLFLLTTKESCITRMCIMRVK